MPVNQAGANHRFKKGAGSPCIALSSKDANVGQPVGDSIASYSFANFIIVRRLVKRKSKAS